MTNITLSIRDDVYSRMKKYPEIKWSEFVRGAIERRLVQLDSLDEDAHETFWAMLVSMETLRADWDNPEDDRWDNV